MGYGIEVVAVVGICVTGFVALVAILCGSTRIKANKEGIDVIAASQENSKPPRISKRKISTKL